MSKADKIRDKLKKSEKLYNQYLQIFVKNPSRNTAYPVFLRARYCGKPVPEAVLEAVIPGIEYLHRQNMKRWMKSHRKESQHRKAVYRLLEFVQGNETIEAGCKAYLDAQEESPANEKDNVDIPALRERLKIYLRDEIHHFIETAPNDLWTYHDKPDPDHMTTQALLDYYEKMVIIINTSL